MNNELEHTRDRRKFKAAMAIAHATEQLMKKQRKDLGLPEDPKPMKIGKITELKFKKGS